MTFRRVQTLQSVLLNAAPEGNSPHCTIDSEISLRVQAGHPRCAGRTKAFFVHEGGCHVATLQTWIDRSPRVGLFALLHKINNTAFNGVRLSSKVCHNMRAVSRLSYIFLRGCDSAWYRDVQSCVSGGVERGSFNSSVLPETE